MHSPRFSRRWWVTWAFRVLIVPLAVYGAVTLIIDLARLVIGAEKERITALPLSVQLTDEYGWTPLPFPPATLGQFPADLYVSASWDDPAEMVAQLLEQHPAADIRAVAEDIRECKLDINLFPTNDLQTGRFGIRKGRPTLLFAEGFREPIIVHIAGEDDDSVQRYINLLIKILAAGHEARHYLQWLKDSEENRITYEVGTINLLMPQTRNRICETEWEHEEPAYYEMCTYLTGWGVAMSPVCDAVADRRAFQQQVFVFHSYATGNPFVWYACRSTWARLAGHPDYQ
mgnify:CR=1 FL=1